MAVLDFACGTGYGVGLLQAAGGARVVGLDRALDAVLHAREHYGNDAAQFAAGDATQLPFRTEAFDLVVCMETIEHVSEVDQLLGELRRVLRRSGTILFSTPNKALHSPNSERPMNPYHVVEYTLEQFRDVLRPYFAVERMLGQQPQDPARAAALRWAPTGALRRLLVALPFVSSVFGKDADRFVSDGLERCRFFLAVCKQHDARA
jgi:ubiquinone/menaquinone biosynthesis C-methylase UbiE